jgi:hypothetical protein
MEVLAVVLVQIQMAEFIKVALEQLIKALMVEILTEGHFQIEKVVVAEVLLLLVEMHHKLLLVVEVMVLLQQSQVLQSHELVAVEVAVKVMLVLLVLEVQAVAVLEALMVMEQMEQETLVVVEVLVHTIRQVVLGVLVSLFFVCQLLVIQAQHQVHLLFQQVAQIQY